jgi:hypothetical protein
MSYKGKDLIQGQRYLFHKAMPVYRRINKREKVIDHFENTLFRANFDKIVVGPVEATLVVREIENENAYQVCMPLNWIENIETLDDILDGKTVIPTDILLEIDNYF